MGDIKFKNNKRHNSRKSIHKKYDTDSDSERIITLKDLSNISFKSNGINAPLKQLLSSIPDGTVYKDENYSYIWKNFELIKIAKQEIDNDSDKHNVFHNRISHRLNISDYIGKPVEKNQEEPQPTYNKQEHSASYNKQEKTVSKKNEADNYKKSEREDTFLNDIKYFEPENLKKDKWTITWMLSNDNDINEFMECMFKEGCLENLQDLEYLTNITFAHFIVNKYYDTEHYMDFSSKNGITHKVLFKTYYALITVHAHLRGIISLHASSLSSLSKSVNNIHDITIEYIHDFTNTVNEYNIKQPTKNILFNYDYLNNAYILDRTCLRYECVYDLLAKHDRSSFKYNKPMQTSLCTLFLYKKIEYANKHYIINYAMVRVPLGLLLDYINLLRNSFLTYKS